MGSLLSIVILFCSIFSCMIKYILLGKLMNSFICVKGDKVEKMLIETYRNPVMTDISMQTTIFIFRNDFSLQSLPRFVCPYTRV